MESIDDHPKAAHNLHGYVLVDRYWIDERPSQLDWLGAKNKPSNLEDRYKVHVQDPKQRHVLHVVVIREVVEQVTVRAPAKVTITGQYNFDPEVRGTSLARPKDKGVYVRPSLGYNQDFNTPTDPSIKVPFDELKGETISMPPKLKKMGQALQAQTATIHSSSTSPPPAKGIKRQREEPIKYGFRKNLGAT